MTKDMVVYTEAYKNLEESILIAFDNAYSDGMDMNKAFVEVQDYVNASGCGDLSEIVGGIYADWQKDHGINCGVLQGSF